MQTKPDRPVRGPIDREQLLRLIEAVMRGMRERSELLDHFECRLAHIDPGPETDVLVAQAARHRRELQTTRRELARIGCSLLSHACAAR